MATKQAKEIIHRLLGLADIQINGPRTWDIQLYDDRFYDSVLHKRSLGLGESYMAGWWDCQELDTCVFRLLNSNLEASVKFKIKEGWQILCNRIFNFQSRHRVKMVAKHYDFGNDLFRYMLDDKMVYSCGYWKTAKDLDEAQTDKLDLICRKLYLAPKMRLLDIGCGWGSLAKYAAEKYGVEVVGITISKEQVKMAKQRCAGLPIDIQLQDYREITGQYDRITSVGMLEHVGHKNYQGFMEVVKRTLAPDGLFLLHTMGSNYSAFNGNEWLVKYIFPNGMLPSIKQLGAACEKRLTMEDWHNLGTDYYPTLMSWHANFNQHWEALKSNYDEQFKRMWNFYLLSCAGTARARGFQVWQIVFSKQAKSRYLSCR